MSRRLPLVRLLLLAVTAAGLAAACAQLARAADGGGEGGAASVTIAPSDGGAEQTLPLADLTAQQDVHDAVYTLRAADAATSELTVAAGVSLEALLAAAGLAEDPFTYAEIVRADGTAVIVLRDQLSGTDEGPPVVWGDEQGAHFLRPSGGDDDPNASDHVVQASGALHVELKTGDPIAARISASALRVEPGEAIDFSASLVAGELSAGMEYQWYFDDNRFATGASVTHRFRRAGRYTVLLNVMRGSEAVGSPAVVVVRISDPDRDADGGARRSGERREDESGGSGGGDGRNGSGGGTGAGAGGGAGSGAPAPAAPAAAPPPVTPPPAPPEPKPKPKPASAPEPQGELVSGTLLASATGAPIPTGDDAPPAAEDEATVPLDVPVGVWVAIGLIAVVAIGWTLESRHTLPFWQP